VDFGSRNRARAAQFVVQVLANWTKLSSDQMTVRCTSWCMSCDVVFKGHCRRMYLDVVGVCPVTSSSRGTVGVCNVTSSSRDTVRVTSSLRDTVGVCTVTSSLRDTVRVTSSLRDTVSVCTVTLPSRDYASLFLTNAGHFLVAFSHCSVFLAITTTSEVQSLF